LTTYGVEEQIDAFEKSMDEAKCTTALEEDDSNGNRI